MRRILPTLLIIGFFTAMVVFLIYWPVPEKAPPVDGPGPAPAAPQAPPAANAAVLIDVLTLQVAADASSEAARTLASHVDPAKADSGSLSPENAAAVAAAAESLVAEGSATVLARPRIMTLSGQAARVTIGALPVPGAAPPVRRSLDTDVRATVLEDGSITLSTTFVRKDITGDVAILLDDLGLPVGTQSASGAFTLEPDEAAYLVRTLRDGSTLLILIRPSAQPAPAPAG